jgi:hypothetical protein
LNDLTGVHRAGNVSACIPDSLVSQVDDDFLGLLPGGRLS